MHPRLIPLLAIAASVAVPAFAQPSSPIPPGWTPPGADPATGARPGNHIGTGMSLPTSDKAGNITHPRTLKAAEPRFLGDPMNKVPADKERREALATWMTSRRRLNMSLPIQTKL